MCVSWVDSFLIIGHKEEVRNVIKQINNILNAMMEERLRIMLDVKLCVIGAREVLNYHNQ
jgi:hypothetical protein